MNAVKNFDIKVLEYSHSAGFESYRTKLSQFYKNQGLPIDFEDIITTGGSEALLLQWEALWIRDEIIILNHFMLIIMVFYCIRVNVVPVISSIDTGFALPPIADFENLLRQKKSNPYM
jgi:aspartate aminotransferase